MKAVMLARDAASYKRPLLSGSVCGCVCPRTDCRSAPSVRNVRAGLQSLQRREPRRLPACEVLHVAQV